MGCAQSTPVVDEVTKNKRQPVRKNVEFQAHRESLKGNSRENSRSNSVSSQPQHSRKVSAEEPNYVPLARIAAELADLADRHDSEIERKTSQHPLVSPNRYHDDSKPKKGMHRRSFSMESVSPKMLREKTHKSMYIYREQESSDSTTKPAMLENLKRAFRRKGSLEAWSKKNLGKGNKKQNTGDSGVISMDEVWGTSPDKKKLLPSPSSFRVSRGSPSPPPPPATCDSIADMFDRMKEDVELERLREKNRRLAETNSRLEDIAELQSLRMERRRKSLNDAAIRQRLSSLDRTLEAGHLGPGRQGRMSVDRSFSVTSRKNLTVSSSIEDAMDWRKEQEDRLGPLPSPAAIATARRQKQKMQQQQKKSTALESVDISSLMEGVEDEEEDLGSLNESSSFNSKTRTYSVVTNSENGVEKTSSYDVVESSQVRKTRAIFEQNEARKVELAAQPLTPVKMQEEADQEAAINIVKLNLDPKFMSTRQRKEKHFSEQDNPLLVSSDEDEMEPPASSSSASSLQKKYVEEKNLSLDVSSPVSQEGTPRRKSNGPFSPSSSGQSQDPRRIAKQALLAAVKKAQEAASAAGWDEEEREGEESKLEGSKKGGRRGSSGNNSFDLEMMARLHFHEGDHKEDKEEVDLERPSSTSPFGRSLSESAATSETSMRKVAEGSSESTKTTTRKTSYKITISDEQTSDSGSHSRSASVDALFDPSLLEIYESAFQEYSPEEWESSSANTKNPRRKSIEVWMKAVAKSKSSKAPDPTNIGRIAEDSVVGLENTPTSTPSSSASSV